MELPQNANNIKPKVSTVRARESTRRFQCKLVIDSWQIFQQLNRTENLLQASTNTTKSWQG